MVHEGTGEALRSLALVGGNFMSLGGFLAIADRRYRLERKVHREQVNAAPNTRIEPAGNSAL